MTLLEHGPAQTFPHAPATYAPQRRRRKTSWRLPVNIGGSERMVSLASGAILAAMGIARRSGPGMLIAGAGGALIFRGATGHSFVYDMLAVDTAHPQPSKAIELADRGIEVTQTFLIDRSPEELYAYWRNFENLPRIMSHLVAVQKLDDRRSRWIARAPRLAGGTVEWDAEIVDDQPNSLIAWQSLPGARVATAGQVRFIPALGTRGTEVHVTMNYLPPAGRLGHWAATAFGQSAEQQIREDLRNFKRIMETGEIPTIVGQPVGTCTGTGELYKE